MNTILIQSLFIYNDDNRLSAFVNVTTSQLRKKYGMLPSTEIRIEHPGMREVISTHYNSYHYKNYNNYSKSNTNSSSNNNNNNNSSSNNDDHENTIQIRSNEGAEIQQL